MRIVSLNCSSTEIVCALGCAEWLVAVDNHSDFPAAVVQPLPRVGPDLTPDIAKVAAHQPDLVLASLTVPGHEKVIAQLQQAGLPHMVLDPVSLADIEQDILQIARHLEVESRGNALVRRMRQAMPNRTVLGQRPSVLVEWWPKPVIVPGKLSWVTDMLRRAGGRNPLEEFNGKSRPLEPAELTELEVDAVVISWCGVPTNKYRTGVVTARPDWQHLPAIREGRVHPVAEAFLGRPGPRVVDGYQAFCGIVDACRSR